MEHSRETTKQGIEAALKRAEKRAKREAQVSGMPIVQRRGNKIVEVRIELDGTKTIVSEKPCP